MFFDLVLLFLEECFKEIVEVGKDEWFRWLFECYLYSKKSEKFKCLRIEGGLIKFYVWISM